MTQYNFRPIAEQYPLAFEKLKAWICKPSDFEDCDVSFMLLSSGKLHWRSTLKGDAADFIEDFFEPTLLPYFFDENGIYLEVNCSGVDFWEARIWVSVTDKTEWIDTKESRSEAESAAFTKAFELLNSQLLTTKEGD